MSAPGMVMSEDDTTTLLDLVNATGSVLLNVSLENGTVDEVFEKVAERVGIKPIEVTPEEFKSEVYERMLLVTAYLAQYIRRRDGVPVQLTISSCTDGVIISFAIGDAMIAYGLSREKTYLAYSSPSETYIIMTKEALPFIDVFSPSEEAARVIRKFLSTRTQGKEATRGGEHE